ILQFNPNSYHYPFISLTPPNRQLQQQSSTKPKNFTKHIIPINLHQPLTNPFQPPTPTFLNSQPLKNHETIPIHHEKTKNLH
ncbi:hypothetical protein, partial [Bacillus sp. WP8]|uniref:hypothetical protein n=1 Tax=Bacillus sp. WP8 TaxID=756828 RepID=UPI001C930295